MLIKPATCRGCPLERISRGYSRPDGLGSYGVMILGEALGYNEMLQGFPFVPWAEAGSVLERAFRRLGLSREGFVLWNVAACQPPDNKFEKMPWEYGASAHCRVHMDEIVARYRPQVFLTLGNTATKVMTGLAGKHRTINSLRGYVIPCARYPGTLVIPSFHPAFLRRGAMKLFRTFMSDICRAVEVAQGRDRNFDLYPRPPVGYNLYPTRGEAEAFLRSVLDNPELTLFYDIETNQSVDVDESEIMWRVSNDGDEDGEDGMEGDGDDSVDLLDSLFAGAADSPITQIQFSRGIGDAICFPWTEGFREIARRLLRTPNAKVGHNVWRFDEPILLMAGCDVRGDRADTLWGWHTYQPDLPAHLQFVASHFGQRFPWKHLAGAELSFYGAIDVDVLALIWSNLPGVMQQKILKGDPYAVSNWDCYKSHIQDYNVLIERMCARGIPIDDGARIQLGEELDVSRERLYEDLDGLYPLDLRAAEPKKGYVRTPKEVAEMVSRGEDPSSIGFFEREFEVEEDVFESYEVPCKCKKACKACGGTRVLTKQRKTGETRTVRVRRWCRLHEFAPSYQQVSNYILFNKYKVPKRVGAKREERDKPSTGKLGLMQLYKSTRDPFFRGVVDYRNVEKLKSTYVDGWKPHDDGKVHTIYTYRPATHQGSTTRPNVQNAIGEKAGELGIRFKSIVRAREGRKIVSIDWTGLHAYMLGYLAKDTSYMRLARLGIHDFVAAHMINRMLQDDIRTAAKNYASAVEPGKEPTQEQLALLEETGEFLQHLDRWLEESDDTLGYNLSWVKDHHSVFRKKVKPAVHGYGFGIGAKKLYDNYPDNFATKSEAQAVLTMLDLIFPLVAQYRNSIREQADTQGFLMTPYGAIRHFSDVFERKRVREDYVPRQGETLFRGKDGGLWKQAPGGQDSEKAIAFLPATCSFGYKKDAMLMLHERGLDEEFWLINEVHDELVFETPDDLVGRCLEEVMGVMQHKSRCLKDEVLAPEGLVCYASAAVGQNWGPWKKKVNEDGLREVR